MSAREGIEALQESRYLQIEVELEPVGARTIQPTTFANTGTSFYVDGDGQLGAVVDSVASMANQLELTVWDEGAERPADPVAPLPWIEVREPDGKLYTTSRRAAHRLNAASLMRGALDPDGEVFESALKAELGDPEVPIVPKLADVLWKYDPLVLLHGCWFPGVWDGRARLTRALSGRIDALGVETQSVQTGGQKTADSVREIAERQAGAEGETVLGEIPHYTEEVSANRIEGHLLLDSGLIRSYALGDEQERALRAVGALQIRELLDAWPRRRSRCVLDVRSFEVRRPEGWELPTAEELRSTCREVCAEVSGVKEAEPRIVRYRA